MPIHNWDAEQRKAVEDLMGSCNFVTLFRGGAGTGKTFTLRELRRELERTGRFVQAIAPQRQQVMGLQRDGFAGAETVSAFLAKGKMPRQAVILVDEAGQLGGKQMHALLELVQSQEGRLILSGDTRQHGAVEAQMRYGSLKSIPAFDQLSWSIFVAKTRTGGQLRNGNVSKNTNWRSRKP
jgi:predicted ribonuclease YlaK